MISTHRYPDALPASPERSVYSHWVRSALARGTYLGCVAEVQGQVIGGAGFTLLEWGPTRRDPSPWRGRVVNVYTEPEWRRRGVARSLLEQVLHTAQGLGVHTLSLGATELSRALYEQLGFQPYLAEMLRHPEQG